MDLYSVVEENLSFPVVIAEGKHLFPFRTEPLSPLAPMVLLGSPSGRVGRRRIFLKPIPSGVGFFCVLWKYLDNANVGQLIKTLLIQEGSN